MWRYTGLTFEITDFFFLKKIRYFYLWSIVKTGRLTSDNPRIIIIKKKQKKKKTTFKTI